MRTRRRFAVELAGLGLLVACKRGGSGARRIAVVPKGTTHEFWKAVHAGAQKAGKESNVEIVWKGPLKEDDLKAQIDVVQSFTAQGVSGIVLAPLSDKGLVASVKSAVSSKIPVVIFDSDLQGEEHVSFVATDNRKAGALAAEHLAKVLSGKGPSGGKVVVLRYQEGSASTMHREEGFLDAARKAGLEIVSDNQYGGATTESAHKTSEHLLSSLKVAADAGFGIFTPNESTTFGMLRALQNAGLAGKVRFVGFDASDKLVDAVKKGEIDALVLQNPFEIGYLAVKTIAAHLDGKAVDKRVDTGATLVTKQNLETPEVAALLKPPT